MYGLKSLLYDILCNICVFLIFLAHFPSIYQSNVEKKTTLSKYNFQNHKASANQTDALGSSLLVSG